MRAEVKNVFKAEHPRLDLVSGTSVPTPVVVIEVDYFHDNGDYHSSASHAFEPHEVDPEYFNRQAEIMQREIDELVERARVQSVLQERHKPADDAVEAMRKHFKLDFKDEVPLADRRG